MEPQAPENTPSTCLRAVISIILGALPLGLLFVCTLRFCTPAFFPIFVLTTGVYLLELVGFLSYWWLLRRTTNACVVVSISLYFAFVFVVGFFVYLGNLASCLQHGIRF